MTTYLGTEGSRIQTYTTNPDNANTGEVWYNATDNVLKFQYPSVTGGWTTGGNLNNARYNLGGTASANTAALAFGGLYPPGDNYADYTELYNGSSWTEQSGDLTTARELGGSIGT